MTWGIVISFQLVFPLLLFILLCFLSLSILFLESSDFMFGVDYAQMGHWGPHPHSSSDDLLFWAELPRTTGQGIAAFFGGALSALGLSPIVMKAGIGISFPVGGISHDLARNKFVEARTVLGHGVSSLVSEAVAGALGCKGVGCCSIRELFKLGIDGSSPPWGFCIEDLGTSWIFALGTLFTVNGIGVSLALGHFVDMAVGFIIEAWVAVAVAVVAVASDFVLWDRGFSINPTLNCFLMGHLLLPSV